MNENQQNQNDNNEITNMHNADATVIGELRKEKIGRPILVVELLVIFLVVMIALPFLNEWADDESSGLYKLLHGSSSTPQPVIPVKHEYEDGSQKQTLNLQTSMKYENLILKRFILGGNKINVTLSSYNGILNLDELPYYIELYSNSNQKLAHIKLTGTYDNAEKTVELTSYGLSFNTNLTYKGMVVNMTDQDYPEVDLSTDESGVGSFICKMDNRAIEYTFKNNYLIGINDTYSVKLAEQNSSDEYLNLKRIYDELANTLGSVATNEENMEGFTFHAVMDLEEYTVPTTIKDYNYYKLDTEAKIIHYAQTGKGFDCK